MINTVLLYGSVCVIKRSDPDTRCWRYASWQWIQLFHVDLFSHF